MASSQIKLYYFEAKGRMEVARIILAAAGKQYEDIRYSFEEWPKHKESMPFGQMPVLEVDGKKYAQSIAIHTYLAREFGFHGKTNLEALKIDQVVQLVEDMWQLTLKAFHVSDEAEKKKAMEQTKAEGTPKFLAMFEKMLKDNGTGYIVADRLTLADIAVYDALTGLQKNMVDVSDKYPLLKKHLAMIEAHPKIGPYLSSRKDTPF